jgi:hypothetical protein
MRYIIISNRNDSNRNEIELTILMMHGARLDVPNYSVIQ